MRRMFFICFMLLIIETRIFAASSMFVNVAIGKVSEVVIPEKVAKVIKGGAVDSVLVEVLENSVYILPKTNTPPDIFITGVSGESYPISLRLSAEHDVRVEVKSNSRISRLETQTQINPLDLMREVLLGREPAGATILKTQKTFNLNDSQIQLRVETIYDYPQIAAYVIKASNLNEQSVIVPVEQISFPGLLAITCDQDMLKAKGAQGDSTRIYLVAGK